MNYCPHCGAPTSGTPYCGNCGGRLTPSEATGAAQSTSEAVSDAERTPAGATGRDPETSLLPKANPFTEMSMADYARDALALLLLLTSFGMPWDFEDSTAGKIYVVLATLLSIMSLALPYLQRTGVLPPSWGTAQVRLARLAANVPYVVVVLATFAIGYGTDDQAGTTGGAGVGIAFGLAGAVIAAQPRTYESVPADAPLWRLVALGLVGAAVVTTLLSVVFVFADVPPETPWTFVTLQLLQILFFAALPVIAAVGMLRHDSAWRDLLVVLGVVGLLAGLWAVGSSTAFDVWPVRSVGPAIVFWPAIGAAVLAAGVGDFVHKPEGSARWVATASRIFELTLLVAGVGVVTAAIMLTEADVGQGRLVTVLVLQLIIAAAALVARSALNREANQGRSVALVVAGLLVVVGIVMAAVIVDPGLYDVTTLSAVFVFATAVIIVLAAPKSVRDELSFPTGATATSPEHRQAAATKTTSSKPSPTAEDRPEPPLIGEPYTAQVAADPATPLEVLADIAAKDPSLRPYVAANPATYPELLEWLGRLGDPAVDEALRGREPSGRP